MLNITLVSLVLVATFVFEYVNAEYFQMRQIGITLGAIAVVTYVLTLLPSILQRFEIKGLLPVILISLRRQLGVLMFVAAVCHGLITATIPLVMQAGLQPDLLMAHEFVGILALMMLLPLWLTSNDLSVQHLGKYWKMLHRLTYVALVLLFIHVSLVTSVLWQVVLGATLVAEVGSWMYSARIFSKTARSPKKQ